MGESHNFILAVFLMYGFIFMIYALASSAGYDILGLPSASGFEPSGPGTGGIIDAILGTFSLIINFFTVLFVPVTDLWYFVPINWAIVGTTIYLFLKLLRGGG